MNATTAEVVHVLKAQRFLARWRYIRRRHGRDSPLGRHRRHRPVARNFRVRPWRHKHLRHGPISLHDQRSHMAGHARHSRLLGRCRRPQHDARRCEEPRTLRSRQLLCYPRGENGRSGARTYDYALHHGRRERALYIYDRRRAQSPRPTQWRSYADLKNLRYYFEIVTNPGIYYIDLTKLDLYDGAPVLKFDTAKYTDVVGCANKELPPVRPPSLRCIEQRPHG